VTSVVDDAGDDDDDAYEDEDVVGEHLAAAQLAVAEAAVRVVSDRACGRPTAARYDAVAAAAAGAD